MSVWNYTLNDTSSMFQYSPYSDGSLLSGWAAAFSLSGFNKEGGQAGSGVSYHVTQDGESNVSLLFYGNGISLLGQANCSYDVTIDGNAQDTGSQQPSNTLFQGSGLSTDLHNITLSSHAAGDNQTLTFYGAVISAPVQGEMRSERLDNSNTSAITYGGSWNTASNYQIPNTQNPSPYHQTSATDASASMNFTGRGIEIKGVKNWGWWTYGVILDGQVQNPNFNGSSWWILPDAVLFYRDGLNGSEEHTIEIVNTGSGDYTGKMALNSFTVFMDDSTPEITPSTSPSSSSSAGLPKATTEATSASTSSHKLSSGAIAGIVVGTVAGLALVLAALFRLYSRKRAHRGGPVNQVYMASQNQLFDPPTSSQEPFIGNHHNHGFQYGHVPTSVSVPSSFSPPPSSMAYGGQTVVSTPASQPTVFEGGILAPPNSNQYGATSAARGNISESRSEKAPMGASFPNPQPVQETQGSSRSVNGGSQADVETVDRIASAVAERLANRLGNDAFTPPPGYVDSDQWHAS